MAHKLVHYNCTMASELVIEAACQERELGRQVAAAGDSRCLAAGMGCRLRLGYLAFVVGHMLAQVSLFGSACIQAMQCCTVAAALN